MKNAKKNFVAVLLTALSVASFNTGWAHSNHSQVKDAIDNVAKTLKESVESKEALQDYVSNYAWKGVIQDYASSGAATLKDLKLNGHSRVVVVDPLEVIDAEVVCVLKREECSAFSVYRVVIGLKGEGAQTTIGNELGLVAGESYEKFSLRAPRKPGLYQVRFKLAESVREKPALESWVDEKGKEPNSSTTIGVIFVRG